MEKTNFRYMQPDDIEDRPDFASVDVSFISLTKILIPARNLLKDKAHMVCLIKPQFEAGKDKVGKKGVVREPEIHKEVIKKVLIFAKMIGFEVKGLSFSPIKGPEGNIEYLVFLEKRDNIEQTIMALTEAEAEAQLQKFMESETGSGMEDTINELVSDVVGNAHQSLD